MIYEFDGYVPVVHPSAFVHPQATVIGDVLIGKDVYIGPGAVLRGDWGQIEVQDGCNVQENCVVHMFPGVKVVLEESAHIGHGAIIHGAHIGRNCLIGMQAVIMDEVVLEEECIVGAMSFVKAKSRFSRRSLIVGNPAKRIREVDDDTIAWKSEGTAIYQSLPAQCYSSLREVEPLREQEENRPAHDFSYRFLKSK